MKQRVLIIIGSRPEAVKLSPVVLAMKESPESFEVCLCSTGQQLDMIPPALKEFGLKADIGLGVMRQDQSLAELTARLVTELNKLVLELKADLILVQGDTTSAMVGALVGFYNRVPVGHVEAGMRTGNRFSPFPEEVNRRIISHCSALHFAATTRNRENLLREGVPDSQVFVTGNTIADAVLWGLEQIRDCPSRLSPHLLSALDGQRPVLVTSHRRENFGTALKNICLALKEVCETVEDVVMVFPVHPNPHVRETVCDFLAAQGRIILVEPLPYLSFIELMNRSYMILTDSGGLQEEAASLGKPVLVLRETSERMEGIDAGSAILVGTGKREIVDATLRLLRDAEQYERMSEVRNLYGDGRAAVRILDVLRRIQ